MAKACETCRYMRNRVWNINYDGQYWLHESTWANLPMTRFNYWCS